MRIGKLWLVIGLLSIAGCGDGVEACEDAYDEIEDCMASVGMSDWQRLSCWEQPRSSRKGYECIADLYSSAECSTEDTLPTEAAWDECDCWGGPPLNNGSC